MPDDSKTNAPIEIIIRVDPTAATQAVKRGADSAWRAAKSETAILCYWIAAAAVVTFIIVALAVSGMIPGKALAIPVVICIWVGLRALKRRYSPMIRD